MAKVIKLHKIEVHTQCSSQIVEDNLENLIEYFGYTLEVGQSYQHERGNKKSIVTANDC